MLIPVGVTWAGLRIAHDAQDARRFGLQHINNKQPSATAKHSQNPISIRSRSCCSR